MGEGKGCALLAGQLAGQLVGQLEGQLAGQLAAQLAGQLAGLPAGAAQLGRGALAAQPAGQLSPSSPAPSSQAPHLQLLDLLVLPLAQVLLAGHVAQQADLRRDCAVRVGSTAGQCGRVALLLGCGLCGLCGLCADTKQQPTMDSLSSAAT